MSDNLFDEVRSLERALTDLIELRKNLSITPARRERIKRMILALETEIAARKRDA